MKAKKSLGQNFLRSEKAIASIIRAGEVKEGDIVLEIGPGEGALTNALLDNGAWVIAVEKDDELFSNLKENYALEIEENRFEIMHGDILELDEELLPKETWKLIANIPYNITGAIIRKFLSLNNQPSRIVLLVQKEVAERIARNIKESILSISVKAYGTPKYIETVKAGSFVPAPKVDSAILLIENISKNYFKNFSEEKFFEMLRAGFASKRKKLSSNLSAIFDKAEIARVFAELNMSENTRAEDVDIRTWKELGEKLI